MTHISWSGRTPNKDLLRVEEAAERLSLGRSKVYELIRDGRLPVVHIGRSVRVPARAVESFVEKLIAESAEGPTKLR